MQRKSDFQTLIRVGSNTLFTSDLFSSLPLILSSLHTGLNSLPSHFSQRRVCLRVSCELLGKLQQFVDPILHLPQIDEVQHA